MVTGIVGTLSLVTIMSPNNPKLNSESLRNQVSSPISQPLSEKESIKSPPTSEEYAAIYGGLNPLKDAVKFYEKSSPKTRWHLYNLHNSGSNSDVNIFH